MEYVDKCNDCDEQQNCKNDAKNEPCRCLLRSGVLDNSNLNVFGHYGPANDCSTLGKLCAHSSSFAVVCNAVYDPSGSVLSCGDESFNSCAECSLIKGTGVTVGQLECAVGGALNCVKNHICGSGCQGGQVGCIENGACRNGDSNIIVGNGYCGVFNGNDNVGCGHCELAVCYCNLFTGGSAIGGGVNLDYSGVTGLVGNGNVNFSTCSCICLVGGCIAVGVYVVVAAVSNTVELDLFDAGHQHVQGQVGESYVATGGGVGPNVTGLCGINGVLKVCKCAVSPFSNGLGVRSYTILADVEAYGNGGFGIVDPEQVDILAEVSNDGVLAEPIPTGLVFEALRNKACKGLSKRVLVVCIICYGVGLGLVELTVYIVVNVVNRSLNVVLSGNVLAGHYKGEVAFANLLAVDIGFCIIITDNAGYVYCSFNGFAFCIPAITGESDVCNAACNNLVVGAVQVSCGIVVEAVLVNKGNGGEVRSNEGNHAVFEGNILTNDHLILLGVVFNVNVSLCVVLGLACERQGDFNVLAKGVTQGLAVAKQSELICLCAAVCSKVSVGCQAVGEYNCLSGRQGCKEVCSQGYFLSLCCSRGKNERSSTGDNSCHEVSVRSGELEGEFKRLGRSYKVVPVVIEVNNNRVSSNFKVIEVFYVDRLISFVVSLLDDDNNLDIASDNSGVIYEIIVGSKSVTVKDQFADFGGQSVVLENSVNCGGDLRLGCTQKRAVFNVLNGRFIINNVAFFILYNNGDGVLSVRIDGLFGLFGSGLLGSGLFRSGLLGSGSFGLGAFGSGLLGSGAFRLGAFGSGFFGSGGIFFDFAFNSSLNYDVLSGHIVNNIAGSNVYPTLSVCIVCIVEHLGEVGAYGKESVENNNTVVILISYAIEIANVNGNVKAGGHLCGIFHNHIEREVEQLVELFVACGYSGYARADNVNYLCKCLFDNFSCIKGNALCKYKAGVACIEIHEAVVSNNCANSGSEEAVNNADCIALYKVVNAVCVFCLVNNCGVEVCKRIGGSCCCLEKVLHIEIVTCNCSELIDNVVNGVIEVAVNLCGQTVGDLNAGNVFKLFYKYFKGRNGCECIYKVLCFEVVGEVIAGNSFYVRKENLCIAGGKSLAIYFAKECGIYCFKNSNDLFKSELLCECYKVIGLCCVSCKNLILKSVHFGIGGICQSFESEAENTCELSGNVNFCYELAVGQANVAHLIEQNRKLCCCCTDHVGACSENKVEVDNLGLFYFAIEVGDLEACGEQLAAVVNVCKLVESRNEIFESIDQACRLELQEAIIVLRGDCNTVDLNFGDGLLHGCKNAECLNEIVLDIEHTVEFFCYVNTGGENNLCELLNVNLVNERANVDSLNQTLCIDNLGDNAIAKNVHSDALNVKGVNKSLEVGYVFEYGLVAANCLDNCIGADSIDSCIVILEASNNVCRRNKVAVESSGDLSLDNLSLNEVSVAVSCSDCIYADNAVSNQLLNGDNAVVEQSFSIQNFVNYVVNKNLFGEAVSVGIDKCFKSILVYVLVGQVSIANNGLDVGKICSILNVDAVELYSLVEINDFKKLCGSEIQSKIHQLFGVIIDKSIGINVLECLFDILCADIVCKDFNVLNVGLQIHILEQADKTVGIYASEKFIGIYASKKRFCVDIANNRLNKIDDLLFGEHSQDLRLGQNITQASAGGHAFDQSLNVAVLDVGQESLRVYGNGNVGRRYVFDLLLVGVHVQPIFSQRTERHYCQNSDDS